MKKTRKWSLLPSFLRSKPIITSPRREKPTPTTYEYLLAFRNGTGRRVHLSGGVPIGLSPEGNEIFWSRYLLGFGLPIKDRISAQSKIRFLTEDCNPDAVPAFTAYGSGGFATQEGKEIIESFDVPNIEFFEASASCMNTGVSMPSMWLVNSHNWKDLIDFERSDFDWFEANIDINDKDRWPEHLRARYRHGPRIVGQTRSLALKSENFGDDLYLIDGPAGILTEKLFVSPALYKALNEKTDLRESFGPEIIPLGLNIRQQADHPNLSSEEGIPFYHFGQPATKGFFYNWYQDWLNGEGKR